MKLFVDDIRDAPDESWVVCRTVISAITAISTFEVTHISLDHDISHPVAVSGLTRPFLCGECYCSVAYYIAERFRDAPKDLVPIITLHTSNPDGARDMASILRNYANIESTYTPAPRVGK